MFVIIIHMQTSEEVYVWFMDRYTNPSVVAGASGPGQGSELLSHLHCGAHQYGHLGTAGLKSVQAPGRCQKTVRA